MKIIILTHDKDRHFYFCNKIIKSTNQVVGVITGGKTRILTENKKRQIYKKSFFYLVRNKILNLLFYNYNKRLFDEKENVEKKYFNGQKFFFYKHYKDLIIGNYEEKYNSINDDYYVSLIREKKPDLILVMGTCLLKKEIISSAPYVINMHTGLSPYYRGGWTNFFPIIDNAYGHFGVTIHTMSIGIDSGDIIFSSRPDIDINDNYSSINCKAIIDGTNLMIKAIELLKRNSLKGVKQWEKGKLIMGRDYNGFLAFIYFLKIKKYILKYISLQQSNLLPKLDFVYNGEKK